MNRIPRRERKMCGTKKRHSCRESAEGEQAWIKRKLGDTVNVYQCPYCHYWHVGRRKVITQ